MFRYFLLLVFVIPFLQGCAEKATPAAPTEFVRSGLMAHSPEYPFHKVWFKEPVDWNRFTRIVVAPVYTKHLLDMKFKNPSELEIAKKEADELGNFAQRKFIESFANDPSRRYRIASIPGPGALILELALTEADPHAVAVEAVSYAGGPVVGVLGWVGGAAVRSSMKNAIAFEARVRDGQNNEVIAMFADREAGKPTLVNIRGLTRYGYARAVIGEWAGQMVQVFRKKPGEKISDSEPFELKLW